MAVLGTYDVVIVGGGACGSTTAYFLRQEGLVLATAPALDQIGSAIADRVGRGKPLKVMYGETYDSFGPTLDSLKYYFTE